MEAFATHTVAISPLFCKRCRLSAVCVIRQNEVKALPNLKGIDESETWKREKDKQTQGRVV